MHSWVSRFFLLGSPGWLALKVEQEAAHLRRGSGDFGRLDSTGAMHDLVPGPSETVQTGGQLWACHLSAAQ